MKNIILITFTLLLQSQGIGNTKSYVYLCNSSGGKKYHYTENCRGLSNCKHEIIKVTLKKAQEMGKTICGYED